MEGGANEVRYKIAEFLLKRMHEDKLLTEEEWEKIRVLNVKTFSPELAKYICNNTGYIRDYVVVYVADRECNPLKILGKEKKAWQKK